MKVDFSKFIFFLAFFAVTQQSMAQAATIEVANGFQGQLYDLAINDEFIYASRIDGNQNNISRVNLTLPNATPEVFVSGVDTPFGLTIHDNFLYVAEFIPQKISRMNLSDNDAVLQPLPISFAADGDGPVAVKVYDDELYYSESIMYIKKVGLSNLQQAPTILVMYTLHPFDFVLEGNFIYAVEEGLGLNRVIRLNLLDTFPPEPFEIAEIIDSKSIVKLGHYLFVGDNGKKIFRIDLNDTNPTPELFYEAPGSDYLGKIKLYNNEIYFPYMFEGSGGTTLAKILKFSETTLSHHAFNSDETITIAPNPAHDFLTIRVQQTIKSITVFNVLGQKVSASQVSSNTLDVSNLQQGTYFIRFTDDKNEAHALKFLKI